MTNKAAGYWWCPYCKEEVGGHSVTYEEMHEACGYPVEGREIGEMVSVTRESIDSDRTEIATLKGEVAKLRGLLEEYAKHAADSGWINLSEEIRRRTAGGK